MLLYDVATVVVLASPGIGFGPRHDEVFDPLRCVRLMEPYRVLSIPRTSNRERALPSQSWYTSSRRNALRKLVSKAPLTLSSRTFLLTPVFMFENVAQLLDFSVFAKL
jgi:hypothetical protein